MRTTGRLRAPLVAGPLGSPLTLGAGPIPGPLRRLLALGPRGLGPSSTAAIVAAARLPSARARGTVAFAPIVGAAPTLVVALPDTVAAAVTIPAVVVATFEEGDEGGDSVVGGGFLRRRHPRPAQKEERGGAPGAPAERTARTLHLGISAGGSPGAGTGAGTGAGLGSPTRGRILGTIMEIPRDRSDRADDPARHEATLVDFGGGRRLERLAGVLVDRPLPQARQPRGLPGLWSDVHVTYTGDREGKSSTATAREPGPLPRGWESRRALPAPWLVSVPLQEHVLRLEVRPAASGQTGLFLEQAPQWAWLGGVTPRGSRLLSLFAHSGAATLAAAAAGAEVVHVDASRQAVALARRNADASGLADAPVRWVCEDARTFVARERRRGNRYDGVVLDPPSWGHGPRGEAFAIDRDLEPLLDDLAALVPAPAAGPLLLSCHSPGWTPARLGGLLRSLAGGKTRIESGQLTITASTGRPLDLGAFARRAPR